MSVRIKMLNKIDSTKRGKSKRNVIGKNRRRGRRKSRNKEKEKIKRNVREKIRKSARRRNKN